MLQCFLTHVTVYVTYMAHMIIIIIFKNEPAIQGWKRVRTLLIRRPQAAQRTHGKKTMRKLSSTKRKSRLDQRESIGSAVIPGSPTLSNTGSNTTK